MQNFPNNIVLTLSENLLHDNYSDSHMCCQLSCGLKHHISYCQVSVTPMKLIRVL